MIKFQELKSPVLYLHKKEITEKVRRVCLMCDNGLFD